MGVPVVTTNAFYRVRAFCYYLNQLAVNVINYRCTDTAPSVQIQDLADAMSAEWAPLYKAFLTAGATYRGITVQAIIQGLAYVQTVSIVGQGSGFPNSIPLPRQTSGLISLKTDLAGRQFRGRLYIPFPYHDSTDTNAVPSATQHGCLVALADQIAQPTVYDTLGGIVTLAPVLFHSLPKQPLPPLAPRPIPDPTPITKALVPYKWATQRRRSDYGQTNTTPI